MNIASETPAARRRLWLLALAGAMVLVAFGAGLLWALMGGAVFYEMVVAGIAACF